MNNKTVKWAAAAGAAAMLLLGSGCARMQDVESLQAEVDRAAAGDAASAADSAMSAANDAQASGAANAEKIDRMFEKAMMK